MTLEILFVDDCQADVDLMLRRFATAGIEHDWKRVDTAAALRAALDGGLWDVVLVDYDLPGFDGLTALGIISAAAPDLPALTVSGAISEEAAVATMHAGAVDYVLKSNLTRLVPAVRSATQAAELRRRQRLDAAHARQSQFAVDHASQAILYVAHDGALLYANRAAEELGGVPRAEAVGRRVWDWTPGLDSASWSRLWDDATLHTVTDVETRVRRADGAERTVSATLDRLQGDEGDFMVVSARDVTERKRAEVELRRFRTILDVATYGAAIVDDDSRFVYVNETIAAMHGWRPDELLGRHLSVLHSEVQMPRFRELSARLRSEGGFAAEEAWHVRRDGSVFPALVNASLIEGEEGTAPFASLTMLDITERVRTTQALRRSEARYARAQAVGHLGHWEYDPQTHEFQVSAEAAQIYGFGNEPMAITAQQIAARTLEWPCVDEAIASLLAGRAAFDLEFDIAAGDSGVVRTVWAVAEVERDQLGEPLLVTGIIQDITADRQADAELRESEKRYRSLFEDSPLAKWEDDYSAVKTHLEELAAAGTEDVIAFVLGDPDEFARCVELARPIDANSAAVRLFEADSREELLMRNSELCQRGPDCGVQKLWAAMLAGEHSATYEVTNRTLRGREIHLLETCTVVPGHEETCDRVYVADIDLTERKRSEEALRASEERYRAMFAENRAIKLLIDPQTGEIVDANPAAADFYGYSRETLRTMRITDINVLPQDAVFAAMDSIEHGQVGEFLFHHRLASGEIRDVDVQSGPIEVEGRRLLFSIVQDVTERRRAELENLRLGRLYRTLGAINRAIVHAAAREDLFAEICRVVVEEGGFCMAWVGVIDETDRLIKPIASAGRTEGYLADVAVAYSDDELGRGPTGTAIREDRCVICQDIASDPRMWPWREPALQRGYRSSAAVPLRRDRKTIGVLTVYSDERSGFDEDDEGLLEDVGHDISFALDNLQAQRAVRLHAEQLRRTVDGTVLAMGHLVESRDPYTAGHERRVAELAVAIAAAMGEDEEVQNALRIAGLLHDIGKVSVPAEILARPGRLSAVEFDLVCGHARAGHDIIAGIDFGRPVAAMVLQHHERLDGSGYPQGLKGDEILPEARILAVSDVVEAMLSHRPYRPALGVDAALAEIRAGAGRLYDPDVVVTCEKVIAEGFTFTG